MPEVNWRLERIPEEERIEAIEVLRPALHEQRAQLSAEIAADPEMWHIKYHFDGGLGVRNLLYHHFGDRWQFDLDDVWAPLVELAVRE